VVHGVGVQINRYKDRINIMGKKELIEKGETQSVEFKESLRLKDEIGD
jgi:hypothetical protein